MVDRPGRSWWQQNSTPQQVLVVLAAAFGALGLLSAGHFLQALEGPLAKAEQASGALGTAVALNALAWFATWRRGRMSSIRTLVLAVLLLELSVVGVYAILQLVHAQHRGVPSLEV